MQKLPVVWLCCQHTAGSISLFFCVEGGEIDNAGKLFVNLALVDFTKRIYDRFAGRFADIINLLARSMKKWDFNSG